MRPVIDHTLSQVSFCRGWEILKSFDRLIAARYRLCPGGALERRDGVKNFSIPTTSL
ncbi:putative bifunctional transcriptional activator/DNA repair enzyme AlkA [Anopheles sinensis]|uniref:Putative bifunctional transcriptional activator/DNA repair enzyme AlkA n=1 Tax=Anopheles sinensis TaxID=74873 RepID=A0A084VR48_ANOSI|nr:putative bifunctional transcriptional activator/DNA repair enzyme AlkA [Anopheles sinensis]